MKKQSDRTPLSKIPGFSEQVRESWGIALKNYGKRQAMTHIAITLIENNNSEKEIEIKSKLNTRSIEVIFLHIYRQCLIYCNEDFRLKSIEFYEEEMV